MARIFISYSKQNPAPTQALAAVLQLNGHSVWWDTNIRSGEVFREVIDRELDAADAVIVIWTPQSITSNWVIAEADHGDRRKRLVTLRTDDVEPWRIPKPYNTYHTPLVNDHDAILSALAKLASGATVPTSAGAAGGGAGRTTAADDRLFAEVEKAGTAEALQFYLDEFPQGAHAPIVRFRLKAAREKNDREAKEAERQRKGAADRFRAEGRINLDATIIHGAPADTNGGGWLKPGAGKIEWFKDHEHGPEMVVVPAGSFVMGSPETEIGRWSKEEVEKYEWAGSEEQHAVSSTLPFAVGRYSITRGEFAAFAAAIGHKTDGGAYIWKGDKVEHDPNGSWRNPGFAQDETHPVVCVNWNDAAAYTTWLSEVTGQPYRLLSEAEWEYAARAGTKTPFWFGDTITTDQANYDGNHVYGSSGAKGLYRKATVPTESFAANPWGLYQVHGNVWEWCADTWHKTYIGGPLDGTTWLEGGAQGRRVVRGGSWNDLPQSLRSAYRNGTTSDVRHLSLGFRVGRTLTP